MLRLVNSNSSAIDNLKFLSPTKVIQANFCLTFCPFSILPTGKRQIFSLCYAELPWVSRNNVQNGCCETPALRLLWSHWRVPFSTRQVPSAASPTSSARSEISAPTLTADAAINWSSSQIKSIFSINFILIIYGGHNGWTHSPMEWQYHHHLAVGAATSIIIAATDFSFLYILAM